MRPMVPCSACGFEHPEGQTICPSTQQVVGVTVFGGRYRVDKLIAVGGIGAVYDARALHIDRRVAVKRLLPIFAGDPEVVRRFQREARAAGRIDHPNVVDVLDYGVGDDGVPFLVMEFLQGETLAARIDRAPGQRLDPAELFPVVMDVLGALEHSHERGIVHRDLKPENIFLCRLATGSIETKVVDLGISKAIGSASQAITQTGSALGTPHYMAPEQLRGDADMDGRVDVYAAGILMYRALTGAFPYDGRTFEQLVTRILETTCPPVGAIRPDIPKRVSDVVAWAMERERDRRAQSAVALARALVPFLPSGAACYHPPAGGDEPAVPSLPPYSLIPEEERPGWVGPVRDVSLEENFDGTTRRRAAPAEAAFRFDVGDPVTSASVPAVESSPQASGSNRRWVVGLGVVALMLAAAVAAAFWWRGSGEEPASPPRETGGLAGAPTHEPGLAHATAVSDAGADARTLAIALGSADGFTDPTDAAQPPGEPADVPARPIDSAEPPVRGDAGASAPLPADASRPTDTATAPVDAGVAETRPADAAPPSVDAGVAETRPADAGTVPPIDPSVAALAFSQFGGAVNACAAGEGAGSFDVRGVLDGATGRLSDVAVSSSTFSANARTCVQALVARLAVPPFGSDRIELTHTFRVAGSPSGADAGTPDVVLPPGLPDQTELTRRLRAARRQALGCTEGVEGSVSLLVRIDGNVPSATLVRVDGNVPDDVRECLARAVAGADVPAFPGSTTVPMRLQ